MKLAGIYFLLLLLSGCSSDGKDPQAVPTTAEDINKAQNAAFGLKTPQDIQMGEFVYTLRTQQIFSGQEASESLLEEESLTIIDRQEFVDYIELTLVKEIIDHTVADSPHYKFKDILELSKSSEAKHSNSKASAQNRFDSRRFYNNILQTSSVSRGISPNILDPISALPSDTSYRSSENEAPLVSIDFFNLKVLKEKLRKPALVLERDPCDDTNDSCWIRVEKISYDMRVTRPPQIPEITSFETWISQDVPYLAAILKNCFKAVLIIDDARPVIQQCTTVVDYKFL